MSVICSYVVVLPFVLLGIISKQQQYVINCYRLQAVMGVDEFPS